MHRRHFLALASAATLAACGSAPRPAPTLLSPSAEQDLAPPAPREFRAAWVATVANIDWPSKPGLPAAEQIAEMRALLDRAVALRLNALILQVRTSADALYDSALEPWSEYLTGTQGRTPGYDPLALWITEAHQRGLELHAWFNPFRARQSGARSAPAASHLSQTHPEWVKRYGDQLWIDPGERAAAEHTLAVFKDVLQRYDVDGIHIDDYFYPYPIPQPGADPAAKLELDFPDEPAWQAYLRGGGPLSRADWRRAHVDGLVERLHRLVRETKPWVRLGISPFGVGKPALRPAGIAGFSQYDKLYADVELWLERGWLDYLVPQLYWPRDQQAQAFGPLLDYWHAQNPRGRHVWPGLFTSKITTKADSWPVEEILGQIESVRAAHPGSGHAHFSMVALKENRRGIADALANGPYAEPALIPACPWLEAGGPGAPFVHAEPDGSDGQSLRLHLQPGPGKPVARYAIWARRGGAWQFTVSSAAELRLAPAELLVVSALDRVGNEGPRAAWQGAKPR